ncbi:uncharacterized protein LOC144151810 [Haemaphysalis longicornis]
MAQPAVPPAKRASSGSTASTTAKHPPSELTQPEAAGGIQAKHSKHKHAGRSSMSSSKGPKKAVSLPPPVDETEPFEPQRRRSSLGLYHKRGFPRPHRRLSLSNWPDGFTSCPKHPPLVPSIPSFYPPGVSPLAPGTPVQLPGMPPLIAGNPVPLPPGFFPSAPPLLGLTPGAGFAFPMGGVAQQPIVLPIPIPIPMPSSNGSHAPIVIPAPPPPSPPPPAPYPIYPPPAAPGGGADSMPMMMMMMQAMQRERRAEEERRVEETERRQEDRREEERRERRREKQEEKRRKHKEKEQEKRERKKEREKALAERKKEIEHLQEENKRQIEEAKKQAEEAIAKRKAEQEEAAAKRKAELEEARQKKEEGKKKEEEEKKAAEEAAAKAAEEAVIKEMSERHSKRSLEPGPLPYEVMPPASNLPALSLGHDLNPALHVAEPKSRFRLICFMLLGLVVFLGVVFGIVYVFAPHLIPFLGKGDATTEEGGAADTAVQPLEEEAADHPRRHGHAVTSTTARRTVTLPGLTTGPSSSSRPQATPTPNTVEPNTIEQALNDRHWAGNHLLDGGRRVLDPPGDPGAGSGASSTRDESQVATKAARSQTLPWKYPWPMLEFGNETDVDKPLATALMLGSFLDVSYRQKLRARLFAGGDGSSGVIASTAQSSKKTFSTNSTVRIDDDDYNEGAVTVEPSTKSLIRQLLDSFQRGRSPPVEDSRLDSGESTETYVSARAVRGEIANTLDAGAMLLAEDDTTTDGAVTLEDFRMYTVARVNRFDEALEKAFQELRNAKTTVR